MTERGEMRMKQLPLVRRRDRLRRNPLIGGTPYRLTTAQLKRLGLRIGDRVWVTMRVDRIAFTPHPKGSRPAEGHVSRRLRRTQPGSVRHEPSLWWRVLQKG
jgi:hypothetical protein